MIHSPVCPVPVADEITPENRTAPVFFPRRRGCRADEPACLRRAGIGLCRKAQKKGGDGFLLASQSQPPACHQIENSRLAWNLDNNRAKCGTGERIVGGAKATRRIGHAKQKHAVRVQAKFEKAHG